MKKNTIYNSGIVFTGTKVLCCKCNCQCGSQGDERVVCVHNFPIIFLLLLLLMDALAESMLMEFAACMRSDIWDETLWSDDDVMRRKKSIVMLASAAGEDMSDVNIDKISIESFIDIFETGTEGRKKWKQRCKMKPKPGDHCCIEDIGTFQSTASEGKTLTSRPILKIINAAGCSDVLESNPIAWQLIKMRSVKQRNDLHVSTRTLLSKSKDYEKQWTQLLLSAKKRTH
mmetsp:Transcript_5746/g.10890  ORF Transcript_5746/g.10890 Transcript_5746/m.10890 type:complete len:229 (+) Transcript_5746:1724-2410(+)